MVSPEGVIAIKLTTNLATLACACIRLWIMQRKDRRSIHDKICHILLFAGCFSDISATGCCAWVLKQERHAIDLLGAQEAEKTVGAPMNLKLLFIAHTMYYLALCLIKAAYLVFYAQLFRRVQSWRRYTLHVACSIWAVSYITAFVLMFLWCAPLSGNWIPSMTNPRCPMILNISAFCALAALNVASDIAIICVPILLVSTLHLGRTERVGLLFVFSIGSVSIIASIVRVVVITDRLKAARMDWDTIHVYMLWTHAEVFFGVVAFMLPAFRFLLRRALERLSILSRGKSANSNEIRFGIHTIGSPRAFPRPSGSIPLESTIDQLESKERVDISINERSISLDKVSLVR